MPSLPLHQHHISATTYTRTMSLSLTVKYSLLGLIQKSTPRSSWHPGFTIIPTNLNSTAHVFMANTMHFQSGRTLYIHTAPIFPA